MAKFIIDEDLPRSTGTILAEAGHEIFDIRDHGLRGAADGKIFAFAQSKKALILTGDMGFSNLKNFPLGSHRGILIAHFPNEMPIKEINRQIVLALNRLTDADLSGNLIIVEPGKIRIRRDK